MVVVLLALSVILNIVLLSIIQRNHSPQAEKQKCSSPRRGLVHASLTKQNKEVAKVTALVEELENFGTKSKVKYIEISGLSQMYHQSAKDILGTIVKHENIEWIGGDQKAPEKSAHVYETERLKQLIDAAEKQLAEREKSRAKN